MKGGRMRKFCLKFGKEMYGKRKLEGVFREVLALLSLIQSLMK
jgi:hypothetical protein